MNRLALLLIFLAAVVIAPAQVTLSTVQGAVTTPVGVGYNFGSVAVGSTASVDFRLTNTGTAAVYLTQLELDGPVSSTPPFPPYFSVTSSLPALPILISVGADLDFSVQFTPFQVGSPNATMTIAAGNTIIAMLSGTGIPGTSTGALVVLQNNKPLAAGEALNFGQVQTGSTQTVKLLLANQTKESITVPAISLAEGGNFSLAGTALSSASVAGGSSAELDVLFKPVAAGAQQSVLTIGTANYPLQGTGVAEQPPDLPSPSIQLDLATPASAQQGNLAIILDSASPAATNGTLTLAFQSAVAAASDDPAVTFSDGTRSAAFSVAKGDSTVKFAGASTISFGTGTTAGTLTFTATFGAHTTQASVSIPSSLIGIDAQVAARNVACAPGELYCTSVNVELQVNGWDNTRSASQLVFTFYDGAGNTVAPGDITVPAGSAFGQYFAGSGLGGVFGMHALFPVTGNSNQIVSAQVQLMNSVGARQTARITF